MLRATTWVVSGLLEESGSAKERAARQWVKLRSPFRLDARFTAISDSVRRRRKKRFKHATMFVSLEPFCHFGKTPPCTQAILAAGIRKVVVGRTARRTRRTGSSQHDERLDRRRRGDLWERSPIST